MEIQKMTAPMFLNKYMAHACGAFGGGVYGNTLEALMESYHNGFRYVEVDLKLTSDNEVVCSHGWGSQNCNLTGMIYREEFANMTRQMFLSQNIRGLHTMDAKMLYAKLKEFGDCYVEIDLRKGDCDKTEPILSKLVEAFRYDDNVLQRCLIQIRTEDMYEDARKVYPFQFFQYVVSKRMDRLEEIMRFCKRERICALALNAALVNKEIIRQIREEGFYILAYTVDDVNKARELFDWGVHTICTNYLTPENNTRNVSLIYNSTPDASEMLSSLIDANILRGKLKKTQKGSYEYEERVTIYDNRELHLMKCQYYKEGHSFCGWTVRSKAYNDCWVWLCDDGRWYRSEDIKKLHIDKKIFEEQAEIKYCDFPPAGNMYFVANYR